MKISIIIPVYNGEFFIDECVFSALNQDIDNFEVICVNDGSTDLTKVILEELSKKYHNLFIINKNNEGPAIAREAGALSAKGKYLMFLDGDDVIAKNCLSKLYDLMEHGNLDMGVFDFVPFKENAEFFHEKIKEYKFESHETRSGLEYINTEMYTAYFWDKIWRKDFYLDYILSGVGGFYYEDQIPILKGFYFSKSVFKFDISCYGYRDNQSSITRRKITIEHYNALRAVILEYVGFIFKCNLLRNKHILMKLGHMLALLNHHRYELKIEFDDEISCFYLVGRKRIVANNDGIRGLVSMLGVFNALYFYSDVLSLYFIFSLRVCGAKLKKRLFKSI